MQPLSGVDFHKQDFMHDRSTSHDFSQVNGHSGKRGSWPSSLTFSHKTAMLSA